MSTSTYTVSPTLRCNQRCGFCTFRRPHDPAGLEARARAELDEATRRGAHTLVLSGGEPTLHPELPALVRRARERGVARVVLETNAMILSYTDRARELAEAGVTRARVGLNAPDAARSDGLTETPGGFALTLRGIENALAEGLEVEISIALTRENLASVPELPAALEAHLGPEQGVRELLVRVVTDADARFVPTFGEAARAVIALTVAARARRMIVRFHGRHAIPLCFFPERRRYPELFAGGTPREADGFARIAACEHCRARERCPGVSARYLETHGAEGAAPVPAREERFVRGIGRDRRRAVEDELINDAFFAQGPGGVERVLRVVFHCNQGCDFCFVDRTLPAVPAERIEREIERAAADGVALLSLSGGEPTLHPELPRFVRSASTRGLRVQLQTNAVRCSDVSYARALAEAGLPAAFVSLHASAADLSDAITRAPGTFDRTVLGVDALLEAGVAVTLNCVITADSHRALPAYARFVIDRWGARVRVNFSFVHASTDLVPRDARMIPRLTDVRRDLGAAITLLAGAGVPHQGFDGQCGMPLCILDAGWLDAAALEALPPPNPPPGFVKPPACAGCAISDRCVGLRETYIELHGDGELAPVSPATDPPVVGIGRSRT